LEGPEIQFAEAIIDNGKFGKRTVRFETGRLAKQAAGSTFVSIDEDTSMLSATAVGKHPREGFDFFPLTVDVEERMYAAGRIPGSFFRREGRPSTDAILACRLIDRPLRPAFAKGIRNEVQVVVTVLTIDPDEIYNTVAINAASMSHDSVRHPVPGAGRRNPHCPHRRPVGCFPQALAARERRLRHGRGRSRGDQVGRNRGRRDHDGRGRGH
jgi:polyribonucleotide nucleotidyltransferase